MAARPDWAEVAVISHWGFIRALTGRTTQNGEMLRVDLAREPADPDPDGW
jgi:broad specificity phosphatase PhoE